MALGSAKAGTAYIPIEGDWSRFDKAFSAQGSILSRKSSKLGKAVGVGIAGGVAAAGVGKALFDLGSQFDDAYDKIRVGTGRTGKELAHLKTDFRAVAKDVPTDFGSIGTAVSDLNKRLGLTGKPLQRVAKQVLNLSRITNTDLGENVAATTRLFGDWSIKTGQQAGTLDKLFRASQATGIGVGELSRLMVQFGSPLRNLGIGFDQAAAMFARFEKEGVNIQTTMPGLRFALKSFAKEGREPAKALQETFDKIKQLGRGSEATSLAFKVFGQRAGPDMAAAVIEGRFNLDKLMRTMRGGSDTINKAALDTEDFSEKWQRFKNRMALHFEPIATRVFEGAGKEADAWFKILEDPRLTGGQKFGKIAERVSEGFSNAMPKIADAAARAAPKIAKAFWEGFKNMGTGGKLLTAAFIISRLGGGGGGGGFFRAGRAGGVGFTSGFRAGVGGGFGGAIGGKIAEKFAEKLGSRGGLFGKIGGAIANQRGVTPANPLFVAVINQGGVTPGGKPGKAGGSTTDKIVKGGLTAKALQVASKALPAGRVVPVFGLGGAGVLAYVYATVNKDLPTGRPARVREAAGTVPVRSGVHERNVGGRVPNVGGKDEAAAAAAAGADQLAKRVRAVRAEIAKMRSGAISDVQALSRQTTENFKRIRDSIGLHTGEGRKLAIANFKATFTGVSPSLKSLRERVTTNTGLIKRAMGEDTRQGKEALRANFISVAKNIRRSMREGTISTREGTAEIERLMVSALRNMGFSKEQALSLRKRAPGSKQAPGGDGGLRPTQRGGPIMGGKPSGDSIPALLERDEYVLNRKAVKRVGRRALDKLNFGMAPRFKTGGAVTGYVQGASPPKGAAIRAFAQEMFGLGFKVTSGYRPSGGTHHQGGDAVDFGDSVNDLGRLWSVVSPRRGGMEELFGPRGLYKRGSKFTDPGLQAGHMDHIHVAILRALGALGNIGAAVAPKLARILVGGPDSPLKALAQGAIDTTRAAAQSNLDSLGSDTAGLGGGTSGSNQGLGRSLMRRYWPGGQWPALRELWQRESGWDNMARNPSSGAFGIPQALPPGKMPAAAQRGDAGSQIGWGLRYIQGRYGSPSAALKFHDCVPLDTDILTRDGWKSYNDVRAGDETLGYNPVTGRNEWTTVTGVHSYEDAPLVELRSTKWHARSTPNHRWAAKHWQRREPGGNEYVAKDAFVETQNITSRHTLRLSAPAHTEGLPISDTEAEVLGWVLGDGSVVAREGSTARQVRIYQVKPRYMDDIAELMADVPHYVADYEQRGSYSPEPYTVRRWGLRAAYARDLLDRSGYDHRNPEAFVLALSPGQRAAFLEGVFKAEGHEQEQFAPGYPPLRCISQADGPQQDAIMLAVYLAGHRPAFTERPPVNGGTKPSKAIRLARPFAGGESLHRRELANAPVWCVTTELGSWTARQDGQIMLTGNSHNWYQRGGIVGGFQRGGAARWPGMPKRKRAGKTPKGKRKAKGRPEFPNVSVGMIDNLVKQIGRSVETDIPVMQEGYQIAADLADRTEELFIVEPRDGDPFIDQAAVAQRVGELSDLISRQGGVAGLGRQVADWARSVLPSLREGIEQRVAWLAQIRERVYHNIRRIRSLQSAIRAEKKKKKPDRGKVRGWEREKSALFGENVDLTGEAESLGDRGLRGRVSRDLENWRGSRESVLGWGQDIGGLTGGGGVLHDTAQVLHDLTTQLGEISPSALSAKLAELRASGGAGADDNGLADLLREQLREANLRTAVSERQFEVFKDFPSGGVFHGGGVVPGPTGAERSALVQGGEGVFTPDQMDAMGGEVPAVHLHIAPGMEWLRKFVRVEYENQGRKATRGGRAPLPGRGGGLLTR